VEASRLPHSGIFKPGAIGWGATYTFDGILVATLVMVIIDTWLWPSPPEPRLLGSIAADLEGTRTRLRAVGQHLLVPGAEPLPSLVLSSRLAPKLAMLKSVEEHSKPTHHHLAALLDAVVTSERLFLEVERLAVLSDELVSDATMKAHREEIATALKVVDASLAERTNEILAGLPDWEVPPSRTSNLRATVYDLNELRRHYSGASTGGVNFRAAVSSLDEIANLLEPRAGPAQTGLDATSGADTLPEAHPLVDASKLRFSIKLGATIVLGLLVGLITQRADLQTILWSIVVAGQPSQYGGVLRKTILRLSGCIVGGLAALAAMRFVSENFDSLPSYMVAIFAVTMFSTYVSQSSEWLGYAGIQTGMTFLICYVGLGPSSDVYRPLWRFWGIVLGVLTTGFVFLVLWPEYATDKLIDSLLKLMRTTLAFAREVAAGTMTDGGIAAVDQRLSTNLLEVLNLADQARLEGPGGLASSTKSVDAAAITIRIAYQFQVIARARLSQAQATLPHQALERWSAWEKEYCVAFESRIDRLVPGRSPEHLSASLSPPSKAELGYTMDDLATAAMSEGDSLAAQVESYRRLTVLLETLDTALSKTTAI